MSWLLLCLLLVSSPLATLAEGFSLIAHRGLPRLHPEHSLRSLRGALAHRPDFVEPDVVLTKDKVAIVLHDIHLDSTSDVARKFPQRKRSDGRYYAIDFSWAEIQKLKISHRFDWQNKKLSFPLRSKKIDFNESIPSLQQFLDTVVQHNKQQSQLIGIYPEIKHPNFHQKEGYDIVSIVHQQLLQFRSQHAMIPIWLQCFDAGSIRRLATELRSPFQLVQLIGENSWQESDTDYDKLKSQEGLTELKKYATAIGAWLPQLYSAKDRQPSAFLKAAKQLGFTIHGYTLRNDALPQPFQSEEEALRFFIKDLQIHGVFTDNIHTTRPLLEKL